MVREGFLEEVTSGLALEGWIGVCQAEEAVDISRGEQPKESLEVGFRQAWPPVASSDFRVCRFFCYKALPYPLPSGTLKHPEVGLQVSLRRMEPKMRWPGSQPDRALNPRL